MIAGLAVGDALGSPWEFTRSAAPSNAGTNLQPFIWGPYHGHGPYVSALGQVTDDTEMTLVLARSLARNGGWRRNDVIQSYINWINSKTIIDGKKYGMRMVGRNTKFLFKGITQVKSFEVRWCKNTLAPLDQWTQSNGAMMRCSPLVVLNTRSFDIINDVSLTNPHPNCVGTNALYLSVLRHVISSSNVQSSRSVFRSAILRGLYEVEDMITDEVAEIVRNIVKGNHRSLNGRNKGWCLNGLDAAFRAAWFAVQNDSNIGIYQKLIQYTIQRGGDTDTTGAITGALIGAFDGYDRLRQDPWFRECWNTVRQSDSNEGQLPRPIEYSLQDFDSVTSGLAYLYSV